MYLDTRLFILFPQVTSSCDVMTVRTRDNKVTKVLVMRNRVLRSIKGDDQGVKDRKEVEPKVLTNQLVKVAGDNRVEINWMITLEVTVLMDRATS